VLIYILATILNILINLLKILFFVKYFKIKKPFSKGQRAGISKLPLLETLRTFKGNIAFENIRLIS
jgi:hypothetical protein